MTGGFNDPIIGGGGALVYPAIHSPGFVAGSAGWSINKDGTAEFNSLTVRNGTVISGVFLMYSSAIPAKGNLIMAFAPVSGGTDPVGNVYAQGFNWGTWDPASGQMKQHFGLDSSGRVFISGPDGVIRIQIDNGSFGTGPDIRFFNDFGAVIMVVDPSRGGVYQYQDNNSAVQGTLIGYSGGKNSTDPVNGTTVSAGVNLIDPVFGDFIQIVGASIIWGVASTLTKTAGDSVSTGATNQGPSRNIAAPEQTQAGHVVQRWYGTSPDGTRAAGTVISLTDPPTRSTGDLLEVQGNINGFNTIYVGQTLKAVISGVIESWHSMTAGLAAGFGAGATTPRYQFEPVNGGRVRLSGLVALTANEVAGTTFFTLPAAWRPATDKHLSARSNFGGGLTCLIDVLATGAMLIQTNGSNGQSFALDGLTYELD